MTQVVKESDARPWTCRVCTHEAKCYPLFSVESEKLDLLNKLKLYLSVDVHEDDVLPRTICLRCKKKLLNVHQFAMMAHRSQVQLKQMFCGKDKNDSKSKPSTSVTSSNSILHAILTQANSCPESSRQSISPISDNGDPLGSISTPDSSLMNIKEEIHDPSYNVIKEEPDDDYEDSYKNEMNADEFLMKEEPLDEDEEDLEVTLDPMMFLYRDETNETADFNKVKQTLEKFNSNIIVKPRLLESNSELSKLKAMENPRVKVSSYQATETATKTLNQTFKSSSRKTFIEKFHLDKFGKRQEPKPYQCAICPRGYFSDIGLQNHLWSHRKILKNSDVGNRDRNGNNSVWKKRKITASNLLSYNNAMFASGTRFQCPLCVKKINTKSNLRRHLQSHKPKGKHSCEICGRIFKSDVTLNRHIETHDDSEELSCPECGRVYPTNSTLKAHMISHSSLRPHQCPHCEKTFKRNQDLKFHLNQHTGERPYKCPFCPKTFASSGNCFSHRKRMHSKKTDEDNILETTDEINSELEAN